MIISKNLIPNHLVYLYLIIYLKYILYLSIIILIKNIILIQFENLSSFIYLMILNNFFQKCYAK